jgi:hypothetical protein
VTLNSPFSVLFQELTSSRIGVPVTRSAAGRVRVSAIIGAASTLGAR